MSDLKVLRELALGRIDLPRGEAILFRLVEYEKGGPRFDLRRYYTDGNDELRPTGKGVGLKAEHVAELRKAIEAFGEAAAEATRRPKT